VLAALAGATFVAAAATGLWLVQRPWPSLSFPITMFYVPVVGFLLLGYFLGRANALENGLAAWLMGSKH
jgi:hypothetical protein